MGKEGKRRECRTYKIPKMTETRENYKKKLKMALHDICHRNSTKMQEPPRSLVGI